MAFDEGLSNRIEACLVDIDVPSFEGKKMFGGIGYMVQGNMACGVHGDNLIVRVGKGAYSEALSRPHTREFDITGRPMTGWVFVDVKSQADDGAVERWVREGVAFAMSLPPK